MDNINMLLQGFSVLLTWQNFFVTVLGAVLGLIVGAMPGIGSLAGVALLLPLTYSFNPTTAVIMLAGIFYGAQYGGSTTAILVNLPGESSSIVTALDGYQMARQGKAGKALATRSR